jgi:hypothetical protein
MRELPKGALGAVDQALIIRVMDEPGPGGANHVYRVLLPGPGGEPGWSAQEIKFQKGPVKECGVNGLTIESLLVICLDRLMSFQSGPFPDDNNMGAIMSLTDALKYLNNRTADRISREVEGRTAP